ncbi:MAG: hypothetical protein HQL14_04650 [Candidatus Omnitrophica bacterium]|nr:hypothetical protein [Candidatus Omnitrophota bacterium]
MSFVKNRVFPMENPPEQHEDPDKLETLICIEALLDICYQALRGLLNNETHRQECLRYEECVQEHQKELRKLFPLSKERETAIASKVYQYLLQLKSPHLFLRAVINLAMSLTAYKTDIYKEFCATDREHRELLSIFLQDSMEEMKYLRREMEFHQNAHVV